MAKDNHKIYQSVAGHIYHNAPFETYLVKEYGLFQTSPKLLLQLEI